MESEFIQIIVQAGAIGIVILMLIINSKERKSFLEYIERKNGYMEKIVEKFDKMLSKHEENLSNIINRKK